MKHLLVLRPGEAVLELGIVLSQRESEILLQLVCAEPPKEVADRIGIRHSTLSTHLKHIREGLNLHTQAQLTRWAMSNSQAMRGIPTGIALHPDDCPCEEPFCVYQRAARLAMLVPPKSIRLIQRRARKEA